MALELAGGAVTGALFAEFLSAVLKVKDNAIEFKPKMMDLEKTLRTLAPVIREIEELNKQLNRPDHSETKGLMTLMEEGKNLVCKCLHVGWWNILKKSRYQKKLVELDNKILRFHILHMQADTTREVKLISLNLNNLSSHLRRRRSFACSSDDSDSLAYHRAPSFKDETYFEEEDEADFNDGEFCRAETGIVLRSADSAGGSRRAKLNCRSIIFVFEKWLSNIWIVMDDAMMLKSTIEQMEATMESLFHVLQQIELYNKQLLNGPDQSETESIRRLMEEGKKLLRECSNIGWWNFPKKWRYQKKLAELDNKLLRFCSLHVQAHMAWDNGTTGNGSEKNENESHK